MINNHQDHFDGVEKNIPVKENLEYCSDTVKKELDSRETGQRPEEDRNMIQQTPGGKNHGSSIPLARVWGRRSL